jgi:hypothetical protein
MTTENEKYGHDKVQAEIAFNISVLKQKVNK